MHDWLNSWSNVRSFTKLTHMSKHTHTRTFHHHHDTLGWTADCEMKYAGALIGCDTMLRLSHQCWVSSCHLPQVGLDVSLRLPDYTLA